jgi:hypothetical protein
MSSAPRINDLDISSLGIPELKRLRVAIDARIQKLEKEQREAAFKEIGDLAQRHGLSAIRGIRRRAGTATGAARDGSSSIWPQAVSSRSSKPRVEPGAAVPLGGQVARTHACRDVTARRAPS